MEWSHKVPSQHGLDAEKGAWDKRLCDLWPHLRAKLR